MLMVMGVKMRMEEKDDGDEYKEKADGGGCDDDGGDAS